MESSESTKQPGPDGQTGQGEETAAGQALPNATKENPRSRRKTKTPYVQPDMANLVGPLSETWTRFHVLNLETTEETRRPPSNLQIWTELSKSLKSDFSCVRRRDGSVLLDAKTERNAQAIQSISEICHLKVIRTRETWMNSSRGIVLIPSSEFEDPSDLKDQVLLQAKAQNLPVSEVEIFHKTSRYTSKKNYFAKITFETRTLPAYMYVGFERVKIREDLPKPRQCQRCWKFGHPIKYCRGSSCCPICGSQEHTLDSCSHKGNRTFPGHCSNCDREGHTAFSKKCALYVKENETLLLMKEQGISKAAARRLLEETGRFRGVSYAAKTSSQSTNSHQGSNHEREPHPATPQRPHQTHGPPEHKQHSSQKTHSHQRQRPKPREETSRELESVEHQLQVMMGSHDEPPHVIDRDRQGSLSPPLPQRQGRTQKTPEPSPQVANLADQPQEIMPTKGAAIDQQLLEILGGHEEPFLSVDTEVHSRSSEDGSVTKHHLQEGPPGINHDSKRRAEIAFPNSPVDNPEAKRAAIPAEQHKPHQSLDSPISTSSPRKNTISKNVLDKLNPVTERASSAPSNPSLPPQIPDVDEREPQKCPRYLGELKPYNERSSASELDGQHHNASNCGCHQCVRELLITKLEPITPGRELSAKFRALVKKRKVYRNTALKNHPSKCLCKTHLERYKFKLPKGQEHPSGSPSSSTSPEPRKQSESTSREAETSIMKTGLSGRVDPRTGLPPHPPEEVINKSDQKENKNSQEQSISVITSR